MSPQPVARAILAWATLAALSSVAFAADLDIAAPAPIEGVACESPEVQTFPSVWLGHFQGGYSHYLGPGQSIVLDWRDERLCFPTQRSCRRHIAEMRHDFHRPEGYFTCLPIR